MSNVSHIQLFCVVQGTIVQLHVKNGDVFEGVLKTMSPQVNVLFIEIVI